MKNIYVIISLALIFSMLLLPLLSLKKSETAGENPQSVQTGGAHLEQSEQISVYMTETGKTEKMDINDYIFGVVAAEMPALYHEEALKAQAVAAYTFALYRAKTNEDKDYDITDSYTTDQHYITAAEAKEKWGEKAAEYEEKIRKAVKDTAGEYLSYGGEAALALYHSISGGKTESCKAVFGQDLPYLTVRDSIGDLTASGYLTTAEFTPAEFRENLSKKVEFSGSESGFLGQIKHRDNGYTESVEICGKTLSGTEIREAFSLRSANFDLKFGGEKFVFTVRGYGHGVGMSQAGAQYMAAQGGTYKDILLWYYKGCEIKKN